MAKVLVTDTYLSDIADAIRNKLGVQTTYTPSQMAAAIASIPTGITPTGALEITENGTYDVTQYATVNINVSGGGSVTIVPWATGTDEEIAAMIDAAHAGTIDLQADGGWAVGDVRTIHISTFTGGGNVAHAAQDIDIVITSFDEYMNCGNVLQFDFKDQLATGNRMNSSNTNSGGYDASEMFTTTLPALVAALPEWLRTRLVEFSCKAGAGSSSTTVETITGNKLALRSEWEVFGSKSYANAGASGAEASEAKQIAYYATSGHRVKKRSHSGSAYDWWLRSPGGSNYFCCVYSNGNANYNDASSSYGLAPFGCL